MEYTQIANTLIKDIIDAPFPIVNRKTPITEVSKLITKEGNAILVDLEDGKYHIITKHDIINAI